MPSILETRRTSYAASLQELVTRAETMMGASDFDADGAEYQELRAEREASEAQLADVDATLRARELAAARPAVQGEQLSDVRRVLREYDRGHSERFDVTYDLERAYAPITTSDVAFLQDPTRLSVPTIAVYTPSLDAVRRVQTANAFDFVVPPPPIPAATVPELQQKPPVEFKASRVEGKLETDAHILDVSRQTLEDDASAERLLRAWLVEGVRLRQDAKVAAAIAGAVGTGTATGVSLMAAIRAGKAELSKLGIRATTVTIHPDDAATADLEAMTGGHTGPAGVSSYWGMNVIENPAVSVGAPIVGALSQALYFMYRSAINTYLTDSGMTVETVPRDRFSHNILGILGEGRSKAALVQPRLLVKCTVAAP
jgi:hypothetical protein